MQETQETTETKVDAARYEAAKADVTAELARTDGKAATLLTALGLPLGVLIVAVPSHRLTPVTAALVMLGTTNRGRATAPAKEARTMTLPNENAADLSDALELTQVVIHTIGTARSTPAPWS